MGEINAKVGDLGFFINLTDAKTGLNWFSFRTCAGPGKIFFLGGLR